MRRFGRAGVGTMGIVFGAILLAWFSGTVGGIGGGIANPIGIAGSETVLLLALFVLVTGGILLAGRRWFAARPSNAAKRATTQSGDEAAVEALKHRYVAGEIDEATFERQLETLFETETVADAKRRVERAPNAADESPATNPEPPAESDAVQSTSRPMRRSRTRPGPGHCK